MTEHDELDPKYSYLYEPGKTAGSAIEKLIEIIGVLRKECPWDREQTHESLKSCLIEEAYEVCDAIDKKNPDSLREELGDVLLQVIFHAQIGAENETFLFEDVVNEVCQKMIRRHPHIFLNESVKSVDKAIEKWENVKRREQGNTTVSEGMNHIPKALPALSKSWKIQNKAADVGFDWDNVEDAFAKVSEEHEELLAAVENGSKFDVEIELGDLLFSVVNVARFLKVNPEDALNRTSQKFVDRFSYIEEIAQQNELNLEDMSLNEMDALWDEAKGFENSKVCGCEEL